jgi:hypothetical protein
MVEPDSGVRRALAGVSRALGSRLQVEVTTDWQRGVRGLSVELGLTVGLPFMRAFSRNRYQPGMGIDGTELLEGSLLWDGGARRLVAGDGRSLGRAGLAGIVYVDEDGDGVMGTHERRLARVRVRVGPVSTETDEHGRFAVWDLIPFEPTEVEIDPGSVRDPLIVASVERFTFRPDPNVFTPLPLAFLPTGEVTGRVASAAGGPGVGGLALELVQLDSGERYPTTTFSDGTFYVLGVRPGRYRVVVSDDDLARLGARAAAVEFQVGRRRDQALVEGIEVVVERAR